MPPGGDLQGLATIDPLVVGPVGDAAVSLLAAGMGRDQLAAMIEPHVLPLTHHLHGLSHEAKGHGVAVGLEAHQAVLGHVTQGAVLQDVGRPLTMIQQQSLLLEKHLGGLPVGRSVEALVGNGQDPVHQALVEMIQRVEGLASQEALDVLHARFDLALGLGPVGSAQPRPEAPVGAEVPEDGVPLDPAAFEVAGKHDRPGVVVEQLVGDAPEVLEGLLVTADQGRQPLVQRGPGKEPAAVAQGHHEEPDVDAARGNRRPAVTPVDLALPAGLRLEAHRGLPGRLFPQGTNEAPHRGIAAGIAHRSKLLEDGLGAPAHGGKPLTDVLLIQAQKRRLRPRSTIRRGLTLLQDLPHRADIQVQRPGDRLLRLLELESAVDLMPKTPVDHFLASRWVHRVQAYLVSHRNVPPFGYSGGHFSMFAGGHFCMSVDSACRRALHFDNPRYRTVKEILTQGLDQAPMEKEAPPLAAVYTLQGRFLRGAGDLQLH